MCELLWSDPQAPAGRSPSKRGVGVAFGPDVTRRFLEDNKLQLLVRSHEARSIVGSLELCLGLHLGSRARPLSGKSCGISGRAMPCRRLCTRCAARLRAWCGLWAGTIASQPGRTPRDAGWASRLGSSHEDIRSQAHTHFEKLRCLVRGPGLLLQAWLYLCSETDPVPVSA